jgi:hypothetical protein
MVLMLNVVETKKLKLRGGLTLEKGKCYETRLYKTQYWMVGETWRGTDSTGVRTQASHLLGRHS